MDRYYLNDFLVQNTYDTAQKQSVSLFTYMLYWLARAYTPDLQNALWHRVGGSASSRWNWRARESMWM